MNYNDAKETLKNYLLARIPLIYFKSVEKDRIEKMLKELGDEGFSNLNYYSMGTGMINLISGNLISPEKTFIGILNYIASDIKNASNTIYILGDSTDLDIDSNSSRLLFDIAKLAEKKNSSVILISENSICSNLKRVSMSIELGYPTEEEIYNLISTEINKYKGSIVSEWGDNEYKEASVVLLGLSEAEIKNVIYVLIARKEITKEDLIDLKFAKSHLFSDMEGLESVDTTDLVYAGLANLKKWLDTKQKLFDVTKKEEIKKRGIKPPRGVLVVGVPGCGKSLTAKAIAKSWNLPLYLLDFAAVQGMYVGQSEERLRSALKTAENVSPCVLWIDEIEKGLAGSRDASGVTNKMIGQFLYWLQECDKEVFVVATANEVESLPAELLRKGRFDEIFFVDLPNTEERKEIIVSYLNKYLQVQADDNFINNLVLLTEGFASSDIESTIRDISYETIANDIPISEDFIVDSFKNATSISKTNPEKVDFIRKWGSNRAKKAS